MTAIAISPDENIPVIDTVCIYVLPSHPQKKYSGACAIGTAPLYFYGVQNFKVRVGDGRETRWNYLTLSCQKATPLAAATLRESTPWDMGMQAV